MQRTTVRGVDLGYETSTGSGPTLVWAHGLTSSRAREDRLGVIDWGAVGTAARVVRYDARGHGTSSASLDPAAYHWRELALDQLALADALGIDRYVAGGASMGAATALHVATLAPERVQALVLVIPPTAWETRAAQQQNYETTAQLVEAGRLDILVEGARSAPPADPLVGRTDWTDAFEEMLRQSDPAVLAATFRGAAATDLPAPDALRTVTAPTLVLAWTGDAGHPVSSAESIARLIPGADLCLASTPGELSAWTTAVAELLAGVGRSAPGEPGQVPGEPVDRHLGGAGS